MLVHYSSLLVVSKGLKCSSHQMWLNLHFRLKPIWISLLLVNYEKRDQKEHPRGPRWTQISFSSIAWIASIRVSHLLDQGPRCSQVDQVGSASSLPGDSLNTEAALLRGFPPGRALSQPMSNEAVGTDGNPFLTGPTFQRDNKQWKNMFLIDDCF